MRRVTREEWAEFLYDQGMSKSQADAFANASPDSEFHQGDATNDDAEETPKPSE